jgi:hypothetical protein
MPAAAATVAVGAYSSKKQSDAAKSASNATTQAQVQSDQIMTDYYREADAQRRADAESALGYLDTSTNKALDTQDNYYKTALENIYGGYEDAGGVLSQAYGMGKDNITAGNQQAIGAITGANDQAINTLGQSKTALEQAYSPYASAGSNAMGRINDMVGSGDYTTSELYKMQRDEGLEALNKQLSASGLRKSGENIKASTDFLNQLGAEEAERQFGRASQAASLTNPMVSQNQSLQAGIDQNVANVQANQGGVLGQIYGDQGYALSDMDVNQGQAQANLDTTQANNLAQMNQNQGGVLSNIYLGLGQNQANIKSGLGSASSQATQQLGSQLANTAYNTQNQLGQLAKDKSIAQGNIVAQLPGTYMTFDAINNPNKYKNTGVLGGIYG